MNTLESVDSIAHKRGSGVALVMTRAVFALLLLGAVYAAFALISARDQAAAHCANGCTGDNYYPRWWKPSHHPADSTVDWKFKPLFPTTAFRDRVRDAAQTWNAEPPAMGLEFQGEGAQFRADCYNLTNPYNGIWWSDMGGVGGDWGVTFRCWHSGTSTMHDAQIYFDSTELWWTGSGPAQIDTLDALGAAVHEFGHALGFAGPYANGHFDPNNAVCFDPEQTMCPYMSYAENNFRTLENHDQHTFDNAY